MAKRLTDNQKEYQKQIKRIRKALSKLRTQGYDVSELAKKYTKDLPNRITKKKLTELQNIKPSNLKTEATFVGMSPKKGTPLATTPFNYQPETITYIPSPTQITPELIETAITPQEEALFREPISQQEDEYIPQIEPEPDYDFYDNITEQERETFEGYLEEQEFNEEPYEEPEPEIMTIDNGKEILWINTATGEIVDRVTKLDDEPIDLSEIAIESLRELGNSFHPIVAESLNKVIDKMIAEKGTKAVADAFTSVTQDRPSLLQMLSSPSVKYDAIQAIVSELCERLKIDDLSKEILRDYITRESMSDMDRYL